MSKKDMGTEAVPCADRKRGGGGKQPLTLKLEGHYVVDLDDPCTWIVGSLGRHQEALEIRIDEDTGDLECRILGGAPLTGSMGMWGFPDGACGACGWQVGDGTFTIDVPETRGRTLGLEVTVDNKAERIELAEVDPANRDLFLNLFGELVEA